MQVYERGAKPERTPEPDNGQAYLLNANSCTIATMKDLGISLDALMERSGGYLGMSIYSFSAVLNLSSQHKKRHMILLK